MNSSKMILGWQFSHTADVYPDGSMDIIVSGSPGKIAQNMRILPESFPADMEPDEKKRIIDGTIKQLQDDIKTLFRKALS